MAHLAQPIQAESGDRTRLVAHFRQMSVISFTCSHDVLDKEHSASSEMERVVFTSAYITLPNPAVGAHAG